MAFTPKYTITAKILENSKRIAALLQELNSHKISQPLFLRLQRQARMVSTFASTSIEGNPLPLAEVSAVLSRLPAKPRDSETEVLNYNTALQFIYKALDGKVKLDLKLILKVHQITTQKLLPDFHSGKIRKAPVLVNDPVKKMTIYWPPDHSDAPKLLEDLIAYIIKNQGKMDSLILAGIFHKAFVVLHPFLDGNGRTVRLLTHFILGLLGLSNLHLLSFERYYNQNVARYFEKVGVRGNYYDITGSLDFTEWLEYFLDGILDELFQLQKELTKQKSNLVGVPLLSDQQKVLNHITEHGSINDQLYSKFTNRAKATRSLDFKKLLALKLIQRCGKGKGTYYTAPS
jgi:Fic family protein